MNRLVTYGSFVQAVVLSSLTAGCSLALEPMGGLSAMNDWSGSSLPIRLVAGRQSKPAAYEGCLQRPTQTSRPLSARPPSVQAARKSSGALASPTPSSSLHTRPLVSNERPGVARTPPPRITLVVDIDET